MRSLWLIVAMILVAVRASAQDTPIPSPLRLVYVLVNFSQNPTQPWTVEQIQQFHANELAPWLVAQSYGTLTVADPTIYGYLTITVGDPCSPPAISSAVREAAIAAGTPLSRTLFDKAIIVHPAQPCWYVGDAVVGGFEIVINGVLSVAAHELGHTFKLLHAHADNVVGSTVTTDDTGDPISIMASASRSTFTAPEKVRLGFLNGVGQPIVQTVSAPGHYWIDTLNSSATERPKALRLEGPGHPADPFKRSTWLYVESVSAGDVRVRRVFLSDIYALDFDPSGARRSAIPVGATQAIDPIQFVALGDQAVTVTVLSSDATGSLIDIALAPVAAGVPPSDLTWTQTPAIPTTTPPTNLTWTPAPTGSAPSGLTWMETP